MAKKTGLGRGLGALLSHDEPDVSLSTDNVASIGEIPVGQIDVNPFQPRTDFNQDALRELAESIKLQGVIQPITVRKLSEGKYQLISGERRLQAAKLIDLETIPAYIRTANDQQMLEMAIIENIQRENLNAIEIALSYQRLMSECDLKQEELGDRVGKGRTTVTNYLRLLKLPPDIQVAVRDGGLSMGHARALINIEDVALQLDVFKKILKEELSVRKVEEYVRNNARKPSVNPPPTEPNPELQKVEQKLTSHFGTRIRIKSGKKDSGEINIPYSSTQELNRILEILDV